MKTYPPRSAYRGWLAGAMVGDRPARRLLDAPDDLVLGYATGYDAARSLRSGDRAFNMKYLSALVGDEISRTLAAKPCICVGTIMGPREDIARRCRTILMLAAIRRSEIGGAFGADQAACNLAVRLIWTRRCTTIGVKPAALRARPAEDRPRSGPQTAPVPDAAPAGAALSSASHFL